MVNFLRKINEALRRFMQGRYGNDALNMFLLRALFVLIIISFFYRPFILRILLWAGIIWLWYRLLSRNIAKRAAENEKFLAVWNKIIGSLRGIGRKGPSGGTGRTGAAGTSGRTRRAGRWDGRVDEDPAYRYFVCPSCGQKMRVPSGKGHIRIRCPKCGTQIERTV